MTANSNRSILRASIISALGTTFSRMAGAARDVAIAHVYGASGVADAFWMAWTVPSLFRRFVADEGLTGALIPSVSQTETAEGTLQAKRLAGSILLILLLACTVIVAGGALAAPWLVPAIAKGFDGGKLDLTVELTRWLFPFVAFVSVVSYCEALLNHRNHFFIPKIAPGIVSLSMGLFAIFLAPRMDRPIFALVTGVLVGGAAHVLICIPPLAARWGLPIPSTAGFGTTKFRLFIAEMGKVIAIGLIAQLNVVTLRFLASFLSEGAVTQYWFANRVVDLAQGAIAVAISSALLPAIAKDAAQGDWEQFRKHFHEAVMLAAIVLLPAAALLMSLGVPIVAILFRHGEFSADSAIQSATTLQMLVPFMLSLAGINIVKKAYFALDDRTTLLVVGALGLAFTAGLGYRLSDIMGVKGLGLTLSISGAIQLVAYLVLLRRRVDTPMGLVSLLSPLGKLSAAAAPAGMAAYGISTYGDWNLGPASFTNWGVLVAATLIALGIYLSLGWMMGVSQIRALIRRVY